MRFYLYANAHTVVDFLRILRIVVLWKSIFWGECWVCRSSSRQLSFYFLIRKHSEFKPRFELVYESFLDVEPAGVENR
jgi:hypothetical protein